MIDGSVTFIFNKTIGNLFLYQGIYLPIKNSKYCTTQQKNNTEIKDSTLDATQTTRNNHRINQEVL